MHVSKWFSATWRLFRLDQEAFYFFLKSLILYVVWNLLPYLIDIIFGKKEYAKIIECIYNLIKELMGSNVMGSFFYLVFNAWQEKSQIKNELNYAIYLYGQLKINIFKEMILVQYNGAVPENIEQLIQINCANPEKAQQYFSYKTFFKINENLDKPCLLNIIQEMDLFLEEFNKISYQFIKNGNFHLQAVFNEIKRMKFVIRAKLEDEVSEIMAFDWTDELILKSKDPLYRLFCEEDKGKDPRLNIMLAIQEKYN
jgi:hypothetical protein